MSRKASTWRAIAPVPLSAPEPSFEHHERGAATEIFEYRARGERYGYVCAFTRSTGERTKLPLTWCVDEGDGRGHHRWHWLQWDEPRPLYVSEEWIGSMWNAPIVIVGSEEAVIAGSGLTSNWVFVTWPGGARNWAKADWSWLRGRTVYLWPDSESQRHRLSKEERDAGIDPLSKPLLAETRQPSTAAMVSIGSVLVADYACQVHFCDVPEPGEMALDGSWNLVNAVAAEWTGQQVDEFIRRAHAFVPPSDEARAKAAVAAKGGSTPTFAGADGEKRAWRECLVKAGNGTIRPVRENVLLAIDGLPDERIGGIEEAEGVIAFNDFTNDVVKLRPAPWGTPQGIWDEVDELELGNWLTHAHWLPSMSRGTLEEAVAMAAKRHRFHPVRKQLEDLRGKWDQTQRLRSWLSTCCRQSEEGDDPQLSDYLARVGTWLVMAMCARVLTPGCKFDYMVIFEGPQGYRKSTLARLLAGEYFADTGLVLGDKDSYQNLQGVWVYEWGELDSLNKAEVTKVKTFVASMKDRFRASFDRRPKDYPRQVVFIGTTNEDHYLVDSTGNRRFWPVRVTRPIDTEWFVVHREQLFAEALQYLEQGERFHPTYQEEAKLFKPQQVLRQVENAIQAEVLRYLYDETQRVHGVDGLNGALVDEISVQDLLQRLGVSVDKRTTVLVKQVTAALRHAGWERKRSSRPDRPWVFCRPKGEAGRTAGASEAWMDNARPHGQAATEGAGDDCPI